jgi:hypothetical protein
MSGMDSKQRHPVNLKQYRKVGGKWQFVLVARDTKGNPDPRMVLLNGEPMGSKGGTFYLDFSGSGKHKQQPVGTVPGEALEAWRTKLAILTGQIEPDPGTREAPDSGLTVDRAIENYLVEVEVTKGEKAGLLVELEPRFGNGLEELARRFDRSTVGCRVGWDWRSCFPTVCSNRCAMARSRRMAEGFARYRLNRSCVAVQFSPQRVAANFVTYLSVQSC